MEDLRSDDVRSLEAYYMARCLTLAARATRRVSPNPRVGCVVLDAQGRKVSEGYHSEAGGPHAEVVALDRAGDRARGGTLFVNLEPCAHHGRTPPCVDRIIESGVERVVCGTLDPNPLVAGRGRDCLQNARISVRYGFLEDRCQALNEAFFQYIRTQRPFVTIKLAMTVDGRIADRVSRPARFTSPSSQQYVHYLRNEHDAILSTAETLLADNPRLTVRDWPMPGLAQPWRAILDRRGRLTPDAFHVFDAEADDAPPRAMVFTRPEAASGPYGERMRAHGVDVIAVADEGTGLDLREVFARLGERAVTSVMTEAGGRLAGRLLTRRLAHKLVLFYAPQALADPYAPSAFAATERILSLGDAPLTVTRARRLEGDWVVEALAQGAPRGVNIVRSYGPTPLGASPPSIAFAPMTSAAPPDSDAQAPFAKASSEISSETTAETADGAPSPDFASDSSSESPQDPHAEREAPVPQDALATAIP